MKSPMERITVLCLITIPLLFSIVSVYLPWWSIQATQRARINANTKITVDYTLFQKVMANDPATNKSITVSFMDLSVDTAKGSNLTFIFNNTLILLIVGIVLTALTLISTLTPAFQRRLSRYFWVLRFVGAILLLIAPLHFRVQAPTALSEVDSVIPSDISTLPGSDIASLWGIKGNLMWRAGFGWFLALIASLILLISIDINQIIVKKV